MKPKTAMREQGRKIGDIIELNDLLELILNNVYSGIIFCDSDSRILFMNQVYADLLGTDRETAVGRHITDFFPSSRLPQVLARGRAELGERCSLKTEAPLLVNRIPITRNGVTRGVILQTIFKDFAEFKDLVAKFNLLKQEADYYKSGLSSVLSAKFTFDSIIGQSDPLRKAKAMALKYARTDAPVLILGPTGSGKELFAQAIHQASARRDGAFVCLNCGAIPRELIESELFGYESGAFTGASKQGKPGKVELAHRGTLYLDEIGDLPQDAQAALLRVLETRIVDKVGGVKALSVDFRLVAATNRDLHEMIRRGAFREDLFYRINAMTLQVPSLADRPGDIPVLIDHFLRAMGRTRVKVSGEAMAVLGRYPWPGNVRELKNVVERAVSLSEGHLLDVDLLPPELGDSRKRDVPRLRSGTGTLREQLELCEQEIIGRAFGQNRENMRQTAKQLGISRSTLYDKTRKHKLSGMSGKRNMSEESDR
ncbi:MAG: sigma-54 interaction domain-containing protein [Syntrophales bacterium]